jgi:hypothetical protein
MNNPNLIIARNSGIRRTFCALCNEQRDFSIGLELFRIDTFELVCLICGQKHAPELVALLALGWLAQNFAQEECEAHVVNLN